MTSTGKIYREKHIKLDGKIFDGCSFVRCRLDYAGGLPPKISNCTFDACDFSFSDAAALTLGFLGGLHAGGFQALVEQTFDGIRAGNYAVVPVGETGTKPAAAVSDLHPLALRVPRVIEVPKRRN